MKIGDEAPGIHRQESMSTRSTQHAGPWLAQLERAWLDGWHHTGQGESDAGRSPVASTPSDASLASQSAAGFSSSPDSVQTAGSVPRIVMGGAAVWPACSTGACGNGGVAPSRGGHTSLRGSEPNALAPRFHRVVPQAQPMVANPSQAGADIDLPPARSAWQRSHAQMSSSPSHAVMQVSLATTTAQVTLRDASLTQGDMSRTGQAIANQLLGLGLHAVRVYVNGVESRHGAIAHEPEPLGHGQAASVSLDALSSSRPPLERN